MKRSALIKDVLIFEQYNKYHMENIEQNIPVDIKAKGVKEISKIQVVVYYQCCILIGLATTRLFGGKKGLKSSFN